MRGTSAEPNISASFVRHVAPPVLEAQPAVAASMGGFAKMTLSTCLVFFVSRIAIARNLDHQLLF